MPWSSWRFGSTLAGGAKGLAGEFLTAMRGIAEQRG
jgi:hypothetical protein